MNNHHIKYCLLAAGAVLAATNFTSCDDVKEADRFIKDERPTISRKVLIQEFTGINCVNCPTGAATVHDIQELYPGSVVVVALHPGGTGFSGPLGNFNLNNELAGVYYNHYQPAGFPAAVIDGESPLTNVSLWPGAVTAALSTPAPADIDILPLFNADTRTLSVDYEVYINNVYNQTLNLNIWIVENGIIGPQKSGSTILPKYEHNHVLRASLTGDWGLALAQEFTPDQTYTGQVSIVFDDNWVPENCDVVAFLQNNDRRVEQATEAPVLPE